MIKIFSRLIIIVAIFFYLEINAQVNLTQGLMLYLPFNGNTLDASGNGNNATNNGALLAPDQFGNPNSAYYFDGVSDFMEVAHNPTIALGNSISLVAKVKASGFYNGTCQANVLIHKGNTDFIPGSYTIRFSDNLFDGSCSIFTPNNENFYGHISTISGTFPTNAGTGPFIDTTSWHCVILTWDGDTSKMFVDGILRHKYQENVSPGFNNNSLFLGKMNNSTFPYWLKGTLDEVRIYNRVLNQNEVDTLCGLNNTPPPTCQSTNYLNITTGIDSSGNQILFSPSNNLKDPFWKISGPSQGYVGAAGITLPNAFITQMQGTSLPWMLYPATTAGTPPNLGNWLTAWPSSFQSTIFNNITTAGYYEINFDRPFTMCTADSVKINVNYAADNYVDYVLLVDANTNAIIDTISNGHPPSAAANPTYLNSLYNAPNYFKYLNVGKYIIRFRVGNFPATFTPNPFSFYNFGSVESATNSTSIIGNTYDTTCFTSANCSLIAPPIINIAGDTTLCAGVQVPISATVTPNANNVFWSPSASLNNANILNPMASPTITTTYTLSAIFNNVNLISNPNFSAGNTSFTSAYTFKNPIAGGNTGAAQYTVGNNPNPWNSFAAPCTDHTSGAGQMLIVKGATTPNVSIWSQTVTVTPNTIYNFSAWVSQWTTINPSVLQFQINGIPLGTPYTAPNIACNWAQFFQTWNSGSNTSATISILNQSTALNGNDFALDDIFFGTVDTLIDSLTITVLPSPVLNAGANQTICSGNSAQLNGTASNGIYNWSPAASLSNAFISNPMATPTTTTIYTLTSSNGTCTSTSTVMVTVSPQSNANAGSDFSICNGQTAILNGSGGSNFLWTGNNLTNTTTGNTTANPATTSIYTLTTSIGGLCSSTDVVTVTVLPSPVLNAGANQTICSGNSAQLNGSASNGIYNWSPAASLSNAFISNPMATPTATTIYTLTSSIGTCTSTSTVMVTVSPQSNANAGLDFSICSGQTATLNGSGGSNFLWTGNNLTNTTTANTTANPATTSIYTLTTSNGGLCSSTDVVTVTVLTTPTVNAGADFTVCQNNTIQLNGTLTGAGSIQWIPNASLSNATILNPTSNISTTTTFSLISTNSIGCSDTDDVTITVNPTPIANAGTDIIYCITPNGIMLNGSGAGSYSWLPATSLSNATIANPIATPTITTNYTLTVSNASGCSSSDIVTITALSTPTLTLSGNFTICTNALTSHTIIASTNANSYTWSPTTGLNSANSLTPIASPTVTTTYTFTAANANGCSTTSVVTASVNNPPFVNAGADVNYCNNLTGVILNGIGTGTVSWSPSNTLSNSNILNPTASPSITTSYTLTVINSGCSASDTVVVTPVIGPQVNYSGITTICPADTTTITASGADNYTWLPAVAANANNSIAYPILYNTTIYTLVGSALNGCLDTALVTITVNPSLLITVNYDSLICIGNTTTLTASGGVNYNWQTGNAPIISVNNNQLVTNPITTSSYTVIGTSPGSCSGSTVKTISIDYPPKLTIFKSNDINCYNSSATLSVSGGNSYSWQPNININTLIGDTIIVTPNSPTTYTVTGLSIACSNSDSIKVNVYGTDPNKTYFPNAFSPNGDLLNDVFTFGGNVLFITYQLRIYNRFGQVVFESYSPTTGWNGDHNNYPAEQGTYYYIFQGTTDCGSINRKGDINLFR